MLLFAIFQYIFASLPNPMIPLDLSADPQQPESRSFMLPDAQRLNLNAASRDELMTLPGIGEKTAEAILALRETLGSFRYPEDLLLVNGIGTKKLETIYDLIYTEPFR
ncbi:MAG: helix-hairpin-helix domain-containing protein [Clostridia bacterium]|nr:helix-hairpin-helix domain-containing protein [Clostridia bacterium]